MAITFTQLATATSSTANTNTYAGNAGTPAANDLLIAMVMASATTATGTMTGTWTWTKYTSFTLNSGADTIYIFWAYASAATSTTPTFDCTGDNATSCSIYVYRVTGLESQKALSPVRFKTNTASTANPSVVMGSAIDSRNGCFGMCANGTNSSVQFTTPSGWAEDSEVGMGTAPTGGVTYNSRASGETASTITWTNSNTTPWGAFVMELLPSGIHRSMGGGMSISSPMNY